MNIKNDINNLMKNVQVDYEMTNNILNNTVRRNKSKLRVKKAVVLTALAVCCMGTMVVGVNGFSYAWNHIVDKIANGTLKVDKEWMIKLSENGYVDVADKEKVKCTRNGVTVSLIQTVSDKKGIYIYLNVKLDKGNLRENMGFSHISINVEDVGEITRQHGDITVVSENEGVIELYGSIANSRKINTLEVSGKKVEVKLIDLEDSNNAKVFINKDGYQQIKNETVADGKWNISWVAKGNKSSKHINIDEELDMPNGKLKINSFEITPLSVNIEFEYPDRVEYEEVEIPFEIIMIDGTKYVYKKEGGDDIFVGDLNSNEIFIRVVRPIDINSIKYINICGKYFEIN